MSEGSGMYSPDSENEDSNNESINKAVRKFQKNEYIYYIYNSQLIKKNYQY